MPEHTVTLGLQVSVLDDSWVEP